MNLKQMTSKNLILMNQEFTTKEQALKAMVGRLTEEGVVTNADVYLNAVLEREKLSPTGFDQKVAIPHGASSSVTKAAFATCTVKSPILDWETITGEEGVELIFLLAIPFSNDGSAQLKMLSELSIALMDETFVKTLKASKTAEEFYSALSYEKTTESKGFEGNKTVLAITACATGIAHTYMSAEALENAGKEMGINVIVERQGANGIENKHTAEQIKNASEIIFACDIAPKDIERYNGLKYINTKVAQPLKNAKELIEIVQNNPDGVVSQEVTSSTDTAEKKGLLSEMMQAVMTGISYMIPVIVAAGLMMGIAKLIALGLGEVNNLGAMAESSNQFYVFLSYLDKFGGLIFKFIYPVFAAYTAYSIADRPGILPGFISGAFAAGMHHTFWGISGGIPSGFLGALVLGLVSGYLARFLNNKIQLSKNLAAMKPMFLLPGITVLVVFILNFYLIDPVFGGLNAALANFIAGFDTNSTLLLTAVIAACTAFDLGGPVNKAAGGYCNRSCC